MLSHFNWRGTRILMVVGFLPISVSIMPLMALVRGGYLSAGILDLDFFVGLERSLLLSSACCILALLLSLARLTSAIQHRRTLRPFDFLLLTPLLLGEVPLGFTFKYTFAVLWRNGDTLFGRQDVFYYAFLTLFHSLVLAQLAYVVLGSNILSAEGSEVSYGYTYGFRASEILRNLAIPSAINSIRFVIALCIVLVGSEAALTEFAFKPGPEQGNELWTHVLYRLLLSMSVADLHSVSPSICVLGLIAVCAIWGCVAVWAFRPSWWIDRGARMASTRAISVVGWIVPYSQLGLIIFIFVACLVAVLKAPIQWPRQLSADSVLWGIVGSIGAGALIMATAVLIGAAVMREFARSSASSNRLWVACSWPLLGMLIPRLLIGHGIQTLRLVIPTIFDGTAGLIVLWVLSQLVSFMPLAVLFVILVNSRSDLGDWRYFETTGIGLTNLIWVVLMRRYRADYLLLAGFMSIFVWLDYSVNRVYSSVLTTFAAVITQASTGRGGAMSVAALLVLFVTVITMVLIVLLSNRILHDQRE